MEYTRPCNRKSNSMNKIEKSLEHWAKTLYTDDGTVPIYTAMCKKYVDKYTKILYQLNNNLMTPDEFNKLNSSDKWDLVSILKNVKWYCGHCGHKQDIPKRTFGERYCSYCDEVLTHRTGGGQGDPFNWVFESMDRELKLKKIQRIIKENTN